MKNTRTLWRTQGVAAVIALAGFVFASCDNGTTYTLAACCDCDCDITCNCAGSDCFCGVLRIGVVRVQGGSFEMGYCPSGEGSGWGCPIRTVTVNGFYMGVFPVTQGEWYDVMGTWPGFFTGANALDEYWNEVQTTPVFNRRDLPVERVSWFDAVGFANALSVQAGLVPVYTVSGTTVTWNRGANGYRLPTEAEWEFAARGGIVCQGNFVFSGSNTAGDVAWTNVNSGRRTHEVGMLDSNALGLYDMSGNIWEWVWDWVDTYPAEDETNPVGAVSGVNRVVRGGGWFNPPELPRSAIRGSTHPDARDYNGLGFRVVRH